MSSQLNRLAVVFVAAFLLVAIASGYWGVVRVDDLTTRGDNPRRILLERRVPRGQILDRNGAVLAESVGEPGSLTRHYAYPELSSLLGYVSPLYGTTGVEAALDPTLHGDEGYDALELWQMGTVLGVPPPGRAVRLSLDLAWQQAADDGLGDLTGAVVVLDSETGEILALASHPTYDANALDTTWSELVADPRSPLLNRVTLGLYQPGGALAPAILTSALATGAVEMDEKANDATEAVTVAGRNHACRQQPATNEPTLAEALSAGCPAPLAALGSALGAEALTELFDSLRLFEPPAIGLPAGAATAETAVTDPAAAAIGHNALAVSPLQLALVTAAIAEHGALPAPRLVLEAQDRDGQWQPVPPAAEPTMALPASAADEVAAWMADGYAASALSGAEGTLLAWFTAFEPADDAQYVVVVLLEGGDVATAEAVGREVLRAAVR